MASFGKELPDQVEPLDRRTEAQLVLLQDVQSIMRERASLEAQYAKSLQTIAKKAERLNKQHIAASVIGDNPSKQFSDDSPKSTLHSALAFLTESLDRTAQAHASFSEVLNIQVADELKNVEKKKEDTRKKHSASYQKLINDRDQIYSERLKAQQKYYSDCEELESYRQKHDKAGDDKSAGRVAKQHEQMQISMLNRKNTYLVSISASNRIKELFYKETVPEVEDQYQTLQTSITARLVGILQNYSSFSVSHFSTLTDTVNSLQTILGSVDHQKDHDLFINYNRRPFTIPDAWSFEPCPNFYDTANMSVEPEPKIFVQNKLARSQEKLEELLPIIETKQREAKKLHDLADSYAKNPKLGPVDSAIDDAFEALHIVAGLKLQQAYHDEEIQTILEAIGDDRGAQAPHSFKPSSFAVPTQCAHCKTNIWGLSKQGKACKACGIAVHNKYSRRLFQQFTKRYRAPEESHDPKCFNTEEEYIECKSRDFFQAPRQSDETNLTRSTHSFRRVQGRYLTTPGGKEATGEESDKEKEETLANVLFDFGASSSIELSVTAGDTVQVVDEDDGSGWVKVTSGSASGLVPASYIQIEKKSPVRSVTRTAPTRKPVPPPIARTKKKLARGLYDYEAAGDDEISVSVGQTIELTPGGDNYGDGWYQGRDATGEIGLFPSNYVELLD